MGERNWKVRFNLGKGKRYMKWKVQYKGEDAVYIDPKSITLIMSNCILKNQIATANKIFNGANKTVCAWVECEQLTIRDPLSILEMTDVYYNPRNQPNWVFKEKNVDGKVFSLIMSRGKRLLTDNSIDI